MKFCAALTIALMIPGVAFAENGYFRKDVTFENFGEKLDVAIAMLYPTAVPEAKRGYCMSASDGEIMNACQFDLGGTPINVRSRNEASEGRADYLSIFAVTDDPAAVARLAELTYLTASMFEADGDEAIAQELFERVKLAAVRAQPFTMEAANFDYEFKTEDVGAFYSVFRAR